MSLLKLIEYFAATTRLPVDPSEVAEQIKLHGYRDEIRFVGVRLPECKALIGMFFSYTRATGVYAEPNVCADIYYDVDQSSEWRRLSCCKELLHVFDAPIRQTHKKEDVLKLINDMSNGMSSHDVNNWGLHGLVDRIALLHALAILFPWSARELLLPEYKSGKLTIEQIATLADLPTEFVKFILGDSWPTLYEVILGNS